MTPAPVLSVQLTFLFLGLVCVCGMGCAGTAGETFDLVKDAQSQVTIVYANVPSKYPIPKAKQTARFRACVEDFQNVLERISGAKVNAVPFDKADDFIAIAKSRHYMLEFFEMMVVVQILSMEIAIRLGNDVDMPRNLAKSVTVE